MSHGLTRLWRAHHVASAFDHGAGAYIDPDVIAAGTVPPGTRRDRDRNVGMKNGPRWGCRPGPNGVGRFRMVMRTDMIAAFWRQREARAVDLVSLAPASLPRVPWACTSRLRGSRSVADTGP